MTFEGFFPISSSGAVMFVVSSSAIAPYTYQNSLKLDAQGRVVVVG